MDESRMQGMERPAFRAESADDLRDLIAQAELIVANLRGAGARAQTLLYLLDAIEASLERLGETGIDLRAETTRVSDIERALLAKDTILAGEMRAVGGLAIAREAAKPGRKQWWWFLDHRVAERRQAKTRRVLTIAGAALAVLLVASTVYNHFFAPDPQVLAAAEKTSAAERARVDGDIATALAYYEEAAQIDPEDPETLVWIGILSEMQGDDAAATEAYRRAEALVDNPAKVIISRGLNRLGMGQVAEAEADAQAALAAAPELAETYLLLGTLYETKGDVPRAVEALEKGANLAGKAGDSALVVLLRVRMGMALQSAPMMGSPAETPTPAT